MQLHRAATILRHQRARVLLCWAQAVQSATLWSRLYAKPLPLDEEVSYVTDIAQIAAYGIMTTPALVVDGQLVSYGKVLKKNEVKALIEKARGSHA